MLGSSPTFSDINLLQNSVHIEFLVWFLVWKFLKWFEHLVFWGKYNASHMTVSRIYTKHKINLIWPYFKHVNNTYNLNCISYFLFIDIKSANLEGLKIHVTEKNILPTRCPISSMRRRNENSRDMRNRA